ncbi:hypothetical protein OpiT1DRAFT_04705 [Opitutaceae bacterium TAV1]|nr:hypothetical protein OpiT1DRAFT_04705 [Opitutaceae bacterium TAV1]
MIHRVTILAMTTALLSMFPLHGETILQYDFSTGLKPSAISSSITATPVEFGPFNGNKNSEDRGRSSAEKGNLYVRVATLKKSGGQRLPATPEQAVDEGAYIDIALRARADRISIDQFTAKAGAQSIGKDLVGDYTIHLFLRSSADKFSTDLGQFSYLKKSDVRGTTFAPAPWTVDLGSLSFAKDTRIIFRIYVYVETEAPDPNQTVRLDDITITSK